MAAKKISELPAGTASASAVVPATNAAGTLTEKVTLGSIVGLSSWKGAFNISATYATGDCVTYENKAWVALSSTTGNEPLLSSSYWAAASHTRVGSYSSSIAYHQGDVAEYNGNLYVAKSDFSNYQPDTNPSQWDVLPVSQAKGIYDGSKSYTQGDVVSYNGHLYLCTGTQSYPSPPDFGVSIPYWTMLTYPSVDSGTYVSGSGSTMYLPSTDIVRMTASGDASLSGISWTFDGDTRLLVNTSSYEITIKNEDYGPGSNSDRVLVPWGGDCVLAPNCSATVFYDGTAQRWRVV